MTTTGDNYVDSKEPQLRGKIATLYSKVASGFQAPSASELDNLKLLEEQFSTANEKFSSVKAKQVPKMEKYMEGKEITSIEVKTFEEFIND